MSDDTLHFRECEACFKSHPQDAMRKCPTCGDAWLHEDCEHTDCPGAADDFSEFPQDRSDACHALLGKDERDDVCDDCFAKRDVAVFVADDTEDTERYL
jgi:hypothetical protein